MSIISVLNNAYFYFATYFMFVVYFALLKIE